MHEVEAKPRTAYHGTAYGGGHFTTASQIEGQDLMSIRQLIETIENEVTIEKENVE